MPDVTINGAEGRLEGKFAPASAGDRAPIALLLHPHPQHGGTMHNKVVYTLNLAFQKAGFSTLRFNFRGVGRSQGSYGRGEGELQDAASALDWIQQNLPNSRGCWIAGFSFGAWIGMQLLMRRPEIDRFIAVAPPANIFDFSFLAPCPSSGLIVQGDKDEIVPEESVLKLSEKLAKQKDIVVDFRVIKGANHFFADRLDKLDAMVAEYAASALPTMRDAAPAPPVMAPPPPPQPERKPPAISLPPDAPSRAEAKKAAAAKAKPKAAAPKAAVKKAAPKAKR
ncbi:MAG: alpha/beta hydrolase [Tagaea sp. CACIAM 22H2]|nr:alpha/beta hydrolase [Tagaea sp. CACIAM 22H2]